MALSRRHRGQSTNALTAARLRQGGSPLAYGDAKNAIPHSQARPIQSEKMVLYKCFQCGKEIEEASLRKRVRCVYCGSKMLYKPRTTSTNVKAR